MGLAFWRQYHEQQAALIAPPSPVKALEAVIDQRSGKPDAGPSEAAVAAPPPPPPAVPTPAPQPRVTGKSLREEAIQAIRSRSRSSGSTDKA